MLKIKTHPIRKLQIVEGVFVNFSFDGVRPALASRSRPASRSRARDLMRSLAGRPASTGSDPHDAGEGTRPRSRRDQLGDGRSWSAIHWRCTQLEARDRRTRRSSIHVVRHRAQVWSDRSVSRLRALTDRSQKTERRPHAALPFHRLSDSGQARLAALAWLRRDRGGREIIWSDEAGGALRVFRAKQASFRKRSRA